MANNQQDFVTADALTVTQAHFDAAERIAGKTGIHCDLYNDEHSDGCIAVATAIAKAEAAGRARGIEEMSTRHAADVRTGACCEQGDCHCFDGDCERFHAIADAIAKETKRG